MAVVKRRLYVKNAAGGYDTVHMETDASCVMMANGATVEAAVNGKAAANHTHVSIGTVAPSNTSYLWVDTNTSTGGIKYHNGSAWVHVPVGYT